MTTLSVLLLIKKISIILGFSSALVNDYFTFKFLRDFKIEKEENKIFGYLATINLICAFVLLLTFIYSIWHGSYIVIEDVLVTSSIMLLVVLVTEIIFRRVVVPRLANWRLKPTIMNVEEVVVLRKAGLALNVISFISWIYLLLLFNFGIDGQFFLKEILLGDYIVFCSVALLLLIFTYRDKPVRQ